MAQSTRATGVDWKGVQRAAVIALAGLTAFIVLGGNGIDRAYSSDPVPRISEKQVKTLDYPGNVEEILRDMLIHD